MFKTDSRMIVPIVGNSKLFKAREQNKTGREKSWKGEFQAQKNRLPAVTTLLLIALIILEFIFLVRMRCCLKTGREKSWKGPGAGLEPAQP
jgi:hypothetical protein